MYIRNYTFNCFFRTLGNIKMKFGQVLANSWQTFLNRFYPFCEDYRLVSDAFMILTNEQCNAICKFLVNDI